MSAGDVRAMFVIFFAMFDLFALIAIEMRRRKMKKCIDLLIHQAQNERKEAYELFRIARLSTDENRVFRVCDTCKQIRTTVADSDGRVFCIECGNLIAVEG